MSHYSYHKCLMRVYVGVRVLHRYVYVFCKCISQHDICGSALKDQVQSQYLNVLVGGLLGDACIVEHYSSGMFSLHKQTEETDTHIQPNNFLLVMCQLQLAYDSSITIHLA